MAHKESEWAASVGLMKASGQSPLTAIAFGRSQMSDPFFQSKSTVESLKEKKMLFTFGTYVTNLRLIDVVDTRV